MRSANILVVNHALFLTDLALVADIDKLDENEEEDQDAVS